MLWPCGIAARNPEKNARRLWRDILNGEATPTKISAERLFPLPICVIMGWVMKMDKEKELPKRKHPRLDNYDYSSTGAYFVTICTQNRRGVLSRIVGVDVLGDPP